ncbi:DUF654-domain-containing protein [Parathielavia hyrcaniae]|uniref:DUF654-domain-containing protein n=1 Tax=Parathielavia hyrcaniae TaxID=113614 RepID=A0AAN6Q1R6_9PEZI|nr:DUF654-domain-containing protein [Parathielavia hyrcaniae]
MASRQLRKLRKQQELLSLQNEAVERSDESGNEPIVTKPRGNIFSGFAALDHEGDDVDDDEGEEEQNRETEDAQEALKEQASGHAEPAKKSKKKPKKKKKKGKQAEPAAPAKDERESIDEIDRVLEELKLEAQQATSSVATTPLADESTSALNELLRVNFQHLKAMNEMRRLFGKAMDVAEVEERTQDNRQRTLPENVDLETFLSARAAHPAQGPRGNKTMFDTILRTNPFIDGKKTWPRGSAQGLKMRRVTEGSQDEVEFAFAHDKAYDALEGSFFGLVQMYDPMQIVHFLHRHPYHISSLIQVSKVARQDQNTALAADLIERALFTFGRASLSEFRKKLERGQARMSFARPENRQFHLAGYNLIQKLVLKGTYRTALEWAKLFLSINRDDPYGMLNWIHVLAIRAREAQWFIDFCRSDLFNGPELSNNIYAQQTLPLAHLQVQEPEAAKSTLTNAMETLPWLYCALFRALNLDTPKSIWAIQPRDEDEALHTQLYIHTAKDLWNTPQHISLLQSAAAAASRTATDRAAAPSPSSPSPARVTLATARFIYLDNTPSLMSLVPRQMLHAAVPNFDFDPLPPPREQNVFSSPTQQLPWTTTADDDDGWRFSSSGAAGGGPRREDLQAAVARLREEIEREVDEQMRLNREAEGQGEATGEETRRQTEDRREGAAPGIMNYLRYLVGERGLEAGGNWVGEWEGDPPTGMPGGWGDWGEEEEDDFEGGDDFEGVDEFEGAVDFEGGGGAGHEGEH